MKNQNSTDNRTIFGHNDTAQLRAENQPDYATEGQECSLAAATSSTPSSIY